MSNSRILLMLSAYMAAYILAAYSLWNGDTLEGIGWVVLVELDRIRYWLARLSEKSDPKSKAKELASLFQASFDKQPKNS